MVRTKLLMTASAALLALSAAASATTFSGDADNTDFDLSKGDFFSGSANVFAGEEITYTFDVLESLTIDEFSTAGTSYDNGENLSNVRFGFGFGMAGDADAPYSQVFEFDSTSAAVGAIDGRSFAAGDRFFFSFMNNNPGTDADGSLVSTAVSFDTVAPIPVPAAGFLLLGALGAGAVASRRSKKTA